MRISDWISDVCSSDLLLGDGHHPVDVDRVAGHDFANLVEGEVMTFEAEAPNEAALATALWSANDDDILHGVSCLAIRFDVLSLPADQSCNCTAYGCSPSESAVRSTPAAARGQPNR